MHILIPKNPKYLGEKYQYHLHSNQFMNEKDTPADVLDTLHERPNPVLMDHTYLLSQRNDDIQNVWLVHLKHFEYFYEQYDVKNHCYRL